jgi:hypothetical protein
MCMRTDGTQGMAMCMRTDGTQGMAQGKEPPAAGVCSPPLLGERGDAQGLNEFDDKGDLDVAVPPDLEACQPHAQPPTAGRP